MECPAMRKLKHGSVHPKGSRGASGKPPCRRRSGDSPCFNKSQEAEVCTAKGWRGRAQSPLLAPAGAKSLRFGKEPLCLKDQQLGRAHLARQCAEGWKSGLGGASADARSYWQGRFAACAFVGGFLGIGRPKNSWGRRKGTKSPLDPFRAIELVALSCFFRVLLCPFSPPLLIPNCFFTLLVLK